MSRRAWGTALLVLAAVIAVVLERAEIEDFVDALRRINPVWCVAAIALQAPTYLCAAGVWQLGLGASGYRQRLRSLVSLAFAMLFGNQAIPSVGMSGGLVVVRALVRRGVPEAVALSALLLGLVTMYAAFVIALVVAVTVVSAIRYAMVMAEIAGTVFAVMAAGVALFAFAGDRLPPAWRAGLAHVPVVGRTLADFATAPKYLPKRATTLVFASSLQLIELLLDAATLEVSLLSTGWRVSFGHACACYAIASIASRVAFVPLGLGTFEAACVTLLHASGVPIATALVATLLFRGFTLWLPMLPGLWSLHRALDVPRVVSPPD